MPRFSARTSPAFRLIALLLLIVACEGEPETIPPEVAQRRQEAARGACVGSELLRRASDDVASLEETLASTSDAPAAEVTRQAGMAALQFARAYLQHAELRAGRYAHIDSAYNHAQRTADSTRHVQAAQGLAIRAPEPGTLEANVIGAYDRNFAALFADADHPCNWDLEE